jgi:hypothetical protein
MIVIQIMIAAIQMKNRKLQRRTSQMEVSLNMSVPFVWSE